MLFYLILLLRQKNNRLFAIVFKTFWQINILYYEIIDQINNINKINNYLRNKARNGYSKHHTTTCGYGRGGSSFRGDWGVPKISFKNQHRTVTSVLWDIVLVIGLVNIPCGVTKQDDLIWRFQSKPACVK